MPISSSTTATITATFSVNRKKPPNSSARSTRKSRKMSMAGDARHALGSNLARRRLAKLAARDVHVTHERQHEDRTGQREAGRDDERPPEPVGRGGGEARVPVREQV